MMNPERITDCRGWSEGALVHMRPRRILEATMQFRRQKESPPSVCFPTMDLSLISTLIAIILATILYAPTVALAKEPTADALTADFLRVAYGDINGDGGGSHTLRRFEAPVRVRIVDNGGASADRIWVERMIAQAAEHSRHDIRLAATGEASNFFVYLNNSADGKVVSAHMAANHTELLGRLKNAAFQNEVAERISQIGRPHIPQCFFRVLGADGRPDLQYGHAFIYNFSEPWYRHRCIGEEILQALGLPGDTDKAWPSIFTDSVQVGNFEEPSRYDWIYLSVLYDPRLHSGMTQAEAAPVVNAILKERLSKNSESARTTAPYSQGIFIPSNDLVTSVFMDAAFHRLSSRRWERFARLETPIRIALAGRVAEAEWRRTAALVEILKQDLGLQISLSNEDPNVIMYYPESRVPAAVSRDLVRLTSRLNPRREQLVRDEIDAALSNQLNTTIQLPFWKRYQIDLSYLIVFTDNLPDADKCTAERLPVSFGPIFLPTPPFPLHGYSIWGACPGELSIYDLLMIRVLFDDRLQPGLAPNETEKIVRSILAELRPDDSRPPDLGRLRLPARDTAGNSVVR